MKNEFDNLEKLFMIEEDGFLSSSNSFADAWPQEKDCFLRALMKNVLQLTSQKQIRYYIRWYQNRIVRLADQVFLKLRETGTEGQERLNLVLDLLEEFRVTFENDFDLSKRIPLGLQTKECTILTPVAGELEAQLEAEGISDGLKQIVLIPFRELFQSEMAPVSFRQLYYVRYYAKKLSFVEIQVRRQKSKDLALSETLIGLSFNNPQLFQYLVMQIGQKARGETRNPREMVTYLKEYRKQINHILIPKGVGYSKAIPSIKKQLLNWLSEEIKLLQAKNNEPDEIEPYLKLNLSVSQMAYLTSLFFKHDVFHEPVKAKVIRGITQTFSSMETTRISPGSFKTKAQEPGDNAVEEVRRLLKAMVKDTENYLG